MRHKALLIVLTTALDDGIVVGDPSQSLPVLLTLTIHCFHSTETHGDRAAGESLSSRHAWCSWHTVCFFGVSLVPRVGPFATRRSSILLTLVIFIAFSLLSLTLCGTKKTHVDRNGSSHESAHPKGCVADYAPNDYRVAFNYSPGALPMFNPYGMTN